MTCALAPEKVERGVDAVLEQSRVAHYLLSLGVVNPRAVHEEDLRIVDVSRRNVVFVVTTSGGPTHVVKQAVPGTTDAITHEAAVLRTLNAVPALRPLVPTVVHFDPERVRLVLGTPLGATPRDGELTSSGARALGRALAAVHAHTPVEPWRAAPPWGLSLHEPTLEHVHQMSAGGLDLLTRIQSSDELCDRLRALRDRPVSGGFVHGDIRWDNCLALAAPGTRRRTRVLLIDWEMAGHGAPEADLGAAFAEYLRTGISSVPIVDPADPGRLADQASRPLERVQPAMRALWEEYCAASPRRVALRAVTEAAAVRLLQCAMEYAQGLTRVGAHVVTLLQVADNMLRSPDFAAHALLGLRE